MAKVKVNIDFKAIRRDVIRESSRALPKVLEKAIIDDNILKGISPVKGKGKYAKYSDSYKKQIRKINGKRARPVNLKLSGELLRSFFVKRGKNGFKIGFKNSLADIHNRLGAGKSKIVRRMLPTRSGEEFNRSITKKLAKELKSIIAKVIRRRSRR